MIGIDLVNLHKFSNKYNTSNNIKEVFTKEENEYALKKDNPLKTLAGIYAAKEAIIKACSLNLAYLKSRRIEIIRNDANQPLCAIDGKVIDANISISHDCGYAVGVCESSYRRYDKIDKDMRAIMPKRDPESHKGDYGRIGILGGSEGMAGSVFMSSLAAMRTGAGLAYIIAPKSISNILQIKSNEQIILPISKDNFEYSKDILDELEKHTKDLDVLAIGPGMGKGKDLNKLVGEVLKNLKARFVIDADGLNAVSKDISVLKYSNDIVLTPHLMEFSRLIGLSLDEINQDRENIAKKFAKENKIILVLKSNETIVTDGNRIYTNKIGNPGMATAGSGDVLTGIIASLLKRLDPYDAAVLGVYIHSLAGDFAARQMGEDSLIATDIIDNISKSMKSLR